MGVPLSTQDKNRVKYHLAYNDSVPDGDRAYLEDRMNNLDSLVYEAQIRKRLDRCDRSLAKTEIDAQEVGRASNRVILGDISRADTEDRAESLKARQKAYIYETDQLALELGVPNYRNPENWANRYMLMSGRIPRIGEVHTSYALTIGSDIYMYYA